MSHKERPVALTREMEMQVHLHDEVLDELKDQTKELRAIRKAMEKLVELLTPAATPVPEPEMKLVMNEKPFSEKEAVEAVKKVAAKETKSGSKG